MSNPIKQLRGQVRQIVKELLPEVFKDTLMKEIQSLLNVEIKKNFKVLDDRQKSIMHFILKQSADKPKL